MEKKKKQGKNIEDSNNETMNIETCIHRKELKSLLRDKLGMSVRDADTLAKALPPLDPQPQIPSSQTIPHKGNEKEKEKEKERIKDKEKEKAQAQTKEKEKEKEKTKENLKPSNQSTKNQEKETSSKSQSTLTKSVSSADPSQQSQDALWEKVQDSWVILFSKVFENRRITNVFKLQGVEAIVGATVNEKQQIKVEKSNSTREIDAFYEQLTNQIQQWKRQALSYVQKTYDKTIEELDLSAGKLHSTIDKINGAYSQAMQQHTNGEPFEALATIRTGFLFFYFLLLRVFIFKHKEKRTKGRGGGGEIYSHFPKVMAKCHLNGQKLIIRLGKASNLYSLLSIIVLVYLPQTMKFKLKCLLRPRYRFVDFFSPSLPCPSFSPLNSINSKQMKHWNSNIKKKSGWENIKKQKM
ncbi:SAM domain-containing protein [Reticulomyxa filosa]|uniref:SAM domain-containing protein n=1 Tax=Reticulomyxa filosa TaxID=46433 RepID=X6NKI1_RETFI|nr:SAM domain-containing protein [Reticulomyxa filosa]|eukprot:ETO26249.1 SAM domain-containing protein [Reticulomyxa filosa]